MTVNIGSASETRTPVVYVVEDDRSIRDATARLLRAAGYTVRACSTANEMLEALPARPAGCVLLDLRLPGLDGLEAQRALDQLEEPLPVVFLSGKSGVAESVQAMKAGAVDFLTKTVDGDRLLEAVATALTRDAEARARRRRVRELQMRHARLSPREREVFGHLISGQLNKQVGFDLGITEQTTKIHRHRVLEKMEAHSIADLVRMAADLNIEPIGSLR
jgi:FixJ family two-component response regulator